MNALPINTILKLEVHSTHLATVLPGNIFRGNFTQDSTAGTGSCILTRSSIGECHSSKFRDVRRARSVLRAARTSSLMRFRLRSRCFMDVRWARWARSDSAPSSPMWLLLISSCWMHVSCTRQGPSDLAPAAPIGLRPRSSFRTESSWVR